MPRSIVPRNGRFGARGAGGRWLGTFDSEREAAAAVRRSHERRPRSSRGTRDVKPPDEAQVLALAAAGPEWLRVMILVAAYTGLRLFEIAGLRAGDLVAPRGRDDWRVTVRHGKGGYADEISAVFEPAVSVLLERNEATGPARLLITNTRGRPVTRQLVSKEFKKEAGRVGFEGTFHALRHFHACWLIDQGASDLDVAAQLRHHDNGEEVRRRYGRHRATSAALRRLDRLGVGA